MTTSAKPKISTGYQLLNELEKTLVERYGQPEKEYENTPTGWGKHLRTGQCYGIREGCVSEDSPMWDSEDLRNAIMELFATYYRTICDKLDKLLPKSADVSEWFNIVVEPSYEDTSEIVIYLNHQRVVVFKHSCKAWNFEWYTPEEMASGLEEDYNNIRTATLAALEAKKGFADLFLIRYEVQDGESEYCDYDFCRAPSIEEAQKLAIGRLKEWWGEDTEPMNPDEPDGTQQHKQGYPAVSLDGIEQIKSLAEIIHRIGSLN